MILAWTVICAVSKHCMLIDLPLVKALYANGLTTIPWFLQGIHICELKTENVNVLTAGYHLI